MKKIDFYKVLIILLFLLNIGMLLFIWISHPARPNEATTPPPPQEHREREPNQNVQQSAGDYLMNELNLNKEQQSKFMELKKKHHENEVALHEQLRELKKQYFDNISENKPQDATSIADKIGKIEKERVANTYNYFRDISNMCNDEQRDRFNHIYRDALRMFNGPPRK